MGYYTNYSLAIKDENGVNIDEEHPKFKELRALFYSIYDEENIYTEKKMEGGIFDDLINDTFKSKWYDHEKNMNKFVAHNPEYTYVLEGLGEDRNDWWIATWKDGKMEKHYAEIIKPAAPSWYSPIGGEW